MKKKMILHIGRHKSGTTSIQSTFFSNKSELQRVGIYYPEMGTRGGAHHLISERMLKLFRTGTLPSDIKNDELISAFFAEIQSTEESIILISSEGFQNVNPAFVRAAFEDFEVLIVVYIREQISYLRSSYQQEVHASNLSVDVEDFEKSFSVDYLRFYESWERSFGRDNIVTRIFEKSKLVNSDVVEDFICKILNEKFELFPKMNKRELDSLAKNLSLCGRYLSFKLRLNRVLSDDFVFPDYLYYVLGNKSEGERNVNFLSPEIVNLVKEKYQASNSALSVKLDFADDGLQFSEPKEYTELKPIGPLGFYAIFKDIEAQYPNFKELFDDLYSYKKELCEDGSLTLKFCKNISTDSINLDLIPSHIDLVASEIELVDKDNREHMLKSALSSVVKKYDFIT